MSASGADLEFVAHEKIIPIASDIFIPIVLTPGSSFKIASSQASAYSPVAVSGVEKAGVSVALVSPVAQVDIGDVDGDGSEDLFVRLTSNGGSYIIVYGAAGSDVPQRVAYIEQAGLPSGSYKLSDYDGDGRDELGFYNAQGLSAAFDISSSGYVASAALNQSVDYIAENTQFSMRRTENATTLVSPPKLASGVNTISGTLELGLPIRLPASLMPVPNLSIAYSSDSGSDILGRGWSLVGVDKIYICDERVNSDSTSRGYCHNGKRLTDDGYLIKGPGDVFLFKDLGNGVFEMDYQNGNVRRYGENGDHTAHEFYLTSVQDPFGRTAYYNHDYGRISSISYDNYTVAFSYDDLGSYNKYYLDNGIAKSTKTGFLRDITVKESNNAISSYSFNYHFDTEFLLDSVQYCVVENGSSTCEAPYEFANNQIAELPVKTYSVTSALSENEFYVANFASNTAQWFDGTESTDPLVTVGVAVTREGGEAASEGKPILSYKVKNLNLAQNTVTTSSLITLAAITLPNQETFQPVLYPQMDLGSNFSVSRVPGTDGEHNARPVGIVSGTMGGGCSGVESDRGSWRTCKGGKYTAYSVLANDSFTPDFNDGVSNSYDLGLAVMRYFAFPQFFDYRGDGGTDEFKAFTEAYNGDYYLRVETRNDFTFAESHYSIVIGKSNDIPVEDLDDIRVSGPWDLNDDGKYEYLVSVSGKYFYHVDISNQGPIVSEISSDNFSIIESPEYISADFDADGLPDFVKIDSTGMTLKSGLHISNGKLNFSNTSTDANIVSPLISYLGMDRINAESFDFNMDGLQDLWVAGDIFLSLGDSFVLANANFTGNEFTCKTIKCVKVVDYDQDGLPELVENRGSQLKFYYGVKSHVVVENASYDGEILISAEYDNYKPMGGIVSPANHRGGLYNNKLKNLYVNNGHKGWDKQEFDYNELSQAQRFSGQGYTSVVKKQYVSTESSSVIPAGFELIVEDVISNKSLIRGSIVTGAFYLSGISRTYYGSDDQTLAVGSVYSEMRYLSTDYVYSIFTQAREATAAGYARKLSDVDRIPDSQGRLASVNSIVDGVNKTTTFNYESTAYPSFVTSTDVSYGYGSTSGEFTDRTVIEMDPNYPVAKSVTYHADNPQLKVTKTLTYDPTTHAVSKEYVSVAASSSYKSQLQDRVVSYGSYSSGQPTSVSRGINGGTDYFTYDVYGNVLTASLVSGETQIYDRDALGRLNSISSNINPATSYEFNYCLNNCLPNSKYQVAASVVGESSEIKYLDSTGAEIGSRQMNQTLGLNVINYSTYDKYGRVYETYNGVSQIETAIPSVYTYTLDGAIKQISSPSTLRDDGSYGSQVVDYDYSSVYECGQYCLEIKETRQGESSVVGGIAVEATVSVVKKYYKFGDSQLYRQYLPDGTRYTYTYDTMGNNTTVAIYGGHARGSNSFATITQTYTQSFDVLGNVIQSTRPGRAAEAYEYSPFGELLSKTYPDGNGVSYSYDDLGRMDTKSFTGNSHIDARTFFWIYDQNKPGMLDKVEYWDAAMPQGSRKEVYGYSYDNYSRPKTAQFGFGQVYADMAYTYDANGRPDELTYNGITAPSDAVRLKSSYTAGVSTSTTATDIASNSTVNLWAATGFDYKGRVVDTDYFNQSLNVNKEYEEYTNQLRYRNLSHQGATLDGEALYFDVQGNLRLKSALTGAASSDALKLNYDANQRLTSVDDASNLTSAVYQYDGFGNFDYKDTTSNKYAYYKDGTVYNSVLKGVANTDVTSATLLYEDNNTVSGTGRMTKLSDYSITYNEIGQPLSIVRDTDGYGASYTYGPEDELLTITYTTGRKVDFWQGMERVTSITGDITYRYKSGGATLLRGHEIGNYYVHKDHLGSIRSVWKDDGTFVATQTFDAYGLRVAVQNESALLAVTDKGYTGHLTVQGTPFIHMKMRLYASNIGMFTSTDPVFADIYMTGGLNAYGYTSGNPMRYVDPDGRDLAELTDTDMSNLVVDRAIWMAQNPSFVNEEPMTIDIKVDFEIDLTQGGGISISDLFDALKSPNYTGAVVGLDLSYSYISKYGVGFGVSTTYVIGTDEALLMTPEILFGFPGHDVSLRGVVSPLTGAGGMEGPSLNFYLSDMHRSVSSSVPLIFSDSGIETGFPAVMGGYGTARRGAAVGIGYSFNLEDY
ncbi:MAG: hypothetical protein COB58_09890 [Thalassobium sp.]|nr:MAG: hypothetical protein COB43_11790 [Oceanospirillales bacterium]PHQ85067.1 MAG: hypothetical protein COB58_09890 [Thalassobium sp.]